MMEITINIPIIYHIHTICNRFHGDLTIDKLGGHINGEYMEYIGKLGGYIIYFHGKRWEHLMNKWRFNHQNEQFSSMINTFVLP